MLAKERDVKLAINWIVLILLQLRQAPRRQLLAITVIVCSSGKCVLPCTRNDRIKAEAKMKNSVCHTYKKCNAYGKTLTSYKVNLGKHVCRYS